MSVCVCVCACACLCACVCALSNMFHDMQAPHYTLSGNVLIGGL